MGPLTSSFSLSLASLLVPAPPDVAFLGVSGGVVMGTPVTFPEFAAAMPGTFPEISGGLLTTPVGTVEDCVAIDDAELERAGDAGLWPPYVVVEAGGEGAVKELDELRC